MDLRSGRTRMRILASDLEPKAFTRMLVHLYRVVTISTPIITIAYLYSVLAMCQILFQVLYIDSLNSLPQNSVCYYLTVQGGN